MLDLDERGKGDAALQQNGGGGQPQQENSTIFHGFFPDMSNVSHGRLSQSDAPPSKTFTTQFCWKNGHGARHTSPHMKPLFASVLAFFCLILPARAASGPIRVLYLGQEDNQAAQHCHVLMRELGREAIWFDYTAESGMVTPEWL